MEYALESLARRIVAVTVILKGPTGRGTGQRLIRVSSASELLIVSSPATEDDGSASASADAPAAPGPTTALLPDGLQEPRPRVPNPRYYGPAWQNK